ncbi:MAG: hypothetical protein M9885_07330 [Burkholderiaceae bacterium]|nr:hypothetical protein [Burkholderiaceae bacterium]
MKPSRCSLRRRTVAAIACLAFVLQSVVPALAYAAASAARAQYYPGALCSIDAHGARVRLAEAIDAETPAPAQPATVAAHCPFCALPAGAVAPPPAGIRWHGSDGPGVALPTPRIDDRSRGPARARPQSPRAPPSA